MKERLQKIISNSGICSRRKAELLISQERVLVNDKIVTLGDRADLDKDIVKVDGCIIPRNINYKVLLLNKPAGIICSCKDNLGRKTVIDMIPIFLRRGIYPIGRLDKDSRGAILLTNNGLLALQLTHPRYHHKKIYNVWIEGIPSIETIKCWRNGVYIDGKKTQQASIKIVCTKKNKTNLRIELCEGKNRQIRKTAEKLGHKVIDLQRIQIANIKLNNIEEGSWREIDTKEWQYLIQ